jgi:hypothetical protein
MVDALFVAACLVSPNRRFWTSPRGVMLNAARIFVVREVAWVAKEIQALSGARSSVSGSAAVIGVQPAVRGPRSAVSDELMRARLRCGFAGLDEERGAIPYETHP